MEYQKMINLLKNTSIQPSKFSTKNWVDLTSMLKSRLCDYSAACVLLRGIITIPNTETSVNPNNRKNIIIKKCASFTDCVSEINITQIYNDKYIDLVMPIYNSIEYNDSMFENIRTFMAIL